MNDIEKHVNTASHIKCATATTMSCSILDFTNDTCSPDVGLSIQLFINVFMEQYCMFNNCMSHSVTTYTFWKNFEIYPSSKLNFVHKRKIFEFNDINSKLNMKIVQDYDIVLILENFVNPIP